MGHSSHGISDEKVADLLAALGIHEHTEEDCRVSEMLRVGIGRPVWVEGRAAWVGYADGTWVRYRISAGDRRRLLLGKTTRVHLGAWTD